MVRAHLDIDKTLVFLEKKGGGGKCPRCPPLATPLKYMSYIICVSTCIPSFPTITADLPMVVSQNHIAVIDPHRRCVKGRSETSPAGTKKKLTSLFKHAGHVSTFESIFDLNTKDIDEEHGYNGTIFRFPLRQQGSNSDISNKVYEPKAIQAKLFESLKEESPYILLFLRNVKSISLMEWNEGASQPHETFRVVASERTDEGAEEGETALPRCEVIAKQCSQSSEMDDSEVYVELKSTAVAISSAEGQSLDYNWLVLKVVGTNDSELDKLGRKLSILPWVGLAIRLPRPIPLCECEATTSMPFDDSTAVEATFSQLKPILERAQLSVKWSSDPVDNTPGHAYCFLPLPLCTAMPVNVHGYFAVTDNRRSIKWPAHDEKGEEAQWNKGLIYKMVAPAYSLLLASRASLIQYEDTPLPVANTDDVTDAYSTWPLHSEVRNVPIWNELVSPTISFSSSLPLLWTSACGGKWVQYNEAYFLPGTFNPASYDCSPAVFELLLTKLDIPIVCLPKAICETIMQNEEVMTAVKDREISPQFFRQCVMVYPDCCYDLSREEVYDMLDYALSDKNCFDLVDVPLLPLKGGSKPINFERLGSDNKRYVFSSKHKAFVKLLPGAEGLIVDPDMSSSATAALNEIANDNYLQIVGVDIETMCRELLPVSIWSWCKVEGSIGWIWTPAGNSMPAQTWLDSLWKWIAKYSVNLSMLEDLPIIPLLASDSLDEQQVTLIKPTKGMLCRLSISFPPKSRSFLISILKKFDLFIVDETRMNNCDKMKQHPDFKDYIPRLTVGLELIAKHLHGLSTSSRLKRIQSLCANEKDFLRKNFISMGDCCAKYERCLKSIPIYRAACVDGDPPEFIALTNMRSGDNAFLPPANESVSHLPDYPSNMLCPTSSSDETQISFYRALSVKQIRLSELCINHLLPLALKHIRNAPNSWSIGDELIQWILKRRYPDQCVLDSLSQNDIICTRSLTHKSPDKLFDPEDSALTKLFSIECDGDHFPNEKYFQDKYSRRALVQAGMKTWKVYQESRTKMYELLLDRMESIHALDLPLQLSRGEFILLTLAEPGNKNLRKYTPLFQSDFLRAELSPTSYPHCLQGKWCGQANKLYSIDQLCPPNSDTSKIVGTAKPILSREYSLGRHAASMNVYDTLPFQTVNEVDVLSHLANLESVVVTVDDIENFNDIVTSVYNYLYLSSCKQKLQSVWWRDTESARFLSAKKFVLEPPENFHVNLEPHYYYLLRTPLKRYARMFNIHSPLMLADLANVITEIAGQARSKLSSKELSMCISILNWLCERKYKGEGTLMLTTEGNLVPPSECVYDDRNWMSDSRSKGQIKAKSLLFVHDKVPQKVAKYFNVVPLSRKVAPSQRLGISYVKAGQHEDITHRIKHIVQDYESNIDIFKELIQNADDAGATEVKFLVDWRHHSRVSLISEELKEWQGPALIAYNNATFSEEDFDNICKVAGETKKKDPLKTGRFGVGFCATYHLTDLPSFVSRRFFTMFDPHTSYLGDRISPQQPGMRVDLVENQADLELYRDQFKPYEDVFGCKIFSLKDEGYRGTLFRFPFRTSQTSKRSKISQTMYDRRMISALVKSLKDQSEELLLFVKNINKLTLYELEKGCSPLSCKKILSVQRKGNGLDERIKLISKYDALNSRANTTGISSCSLNFDIEVEDGTTKECSQTSWVLSSVIETCADSHLADHPESAGLLPLAEIALKVDPSQQSWSCLPIQNSDAGKVFCFLPLPIKSKLPFHVNGFFSVGKDRRNVSATDDKSFGSSWNKSLAKGALYESFVKLLLYLSNKCDLKAVAGTRLKQQYLDIYYSVWHLNAKGLIGETFVSTFKERASELTCPLIWSEIDGGCWLPPTQVVVFQDKKLEEHSAIKQDAISVLLTHGHGLANLPPHLFHVLKKSLKESGRLFNYQKFCEEILFPEISTINSEVRNRNIKFLAERFGVYSGDDHWYKWAKDFLVKHACIPCEGTDVLRPSSELIDPTTEIFGKLYDVHDGRFPSKELQKSYNAKKGLRTLGMTWHKLRIADLKDRAETVMRIDIDDRESALQRSAHICTYIKHAYGESVELNLPPNKELWELSCVPFLPIKQRPNDVDVPWSRGTKTFGSPSQVYSPYRMHLVFSQHPVVDVDAFEVLKCLEISARWPTLDMIISHLKCIIHHVSHRPNDTTINFLNESMKKVYDYLYSHHSEAKDIKHILVNLGRIIWQDGHFLSLDQVVKEWKHNCFPYLCELSSLNKLNLFLQKLDVKDKPTGEMLENILRKVAEDFPLMPLSDDILTFLEPVIRSLAFAVKHSHHKLCHPLKLPDENKIMRNVSHLAENVGDAENSEWLMKLDLFSEFLSSGECHFVHNSIPRDRAITLGVRPLLEAVVKEIEDVSFLQGTPFGQQEDLCDRLNGILDKYPPGISIFQEFIQNADDARATEIMFVLDHRTKRSSDSKLISSDRKWKSLQKTPALCIFNNRKFTDTDIEGITKLGRGGKEGAPDLIGKFGIGFNVAYHVTDCPSFVSFAENGNPEYLCVFDPTRSFLPIEKNELPGKKWDFKDQQHCAGFSNQFQPYLSEDLSKLGENAPNILQDRKHGYVVFRLPLTRSTSQKSPETTPHSRQKLVLDSGARFTPSELSHLLNDFASMSQDMILFLNHLRSISVFEIQGDSSYEHRFTTTGSVPKCYHSNFQQYSRALRNCVEMVEKGHPVNRTSLPHQMSITHVVTKKLYCSKRTSQWLVQRVVGGKDLSVDLLQAGLHQGLRAIGGVATLLKPVPGYEYHLFCFLPLPIPSNLPVHVNGHFLVDDSRKHLETIAHKGLKEWNHMLARKVIVPAYVDLVTTAKQLMFNGEETDKHRVKEFYSLFPVSDVSSEMDKDVGELENLNIVHNFYKELLHQNPAVIVRKLPNPDLAIHWISLKSCLFYVKFYFRDKLLSPNANVCKVLVSLGLPIADTPDFIYSECSKVDRHFSITARVDPGKIVKQLRSRRCTEQQKEVIKENIQAFLKYCIAGYRSEEIAGLFQDALYLLAHDGSLQRGNLFHSAFSKLLPHCARNFIEPKLEISEVGVKLKECKVVCQLPLDFVSAHISLPNTNSYIDIDTNNSATVKLLWECIADQCETGTTAELLEKYFFNKPIIPASDNRLYPVSSSKALLRDTSSNCNYCSVMKKLGYPQIDFDQVSFKGNDSSESLSVHWNVVNALTSCFKDRQDVIECFRLRAPREFSVSFTDEEAQSFSSLLGMQCDNSLRTVSKYLLKLPLFHTIRGSRIDLCGLSQVFILSSINFPTESIPEVHKGRVVLSDAQSKFLANFYSGVIPEHMRTYVKPEELYIQYVLPIIQEISEEDVKKHVKYIYLHKDDDMKKAFLKLKKVAFIKHHDKLYKASELCDPNVAFYAEFHQDSILPDTWCRDCTILPILKSLGLRTEVTTAEWLKGATDLAKRFSVMSVSDIKRRSELLLDKLIEITEDPIKTPEFTLFLKTVADIKFIYCPQDWSLIQILSHVSTDKKYTDTNSMVKLGGSVFFSEAAYACLCTTVLPKSCQPLVSNKAIRNALHIEAPASPNTVAENLRRLCSHLNATCARSLDINHEQVKKLVAIFEKHYECLSARNPDFDTLTDFKDMMCVLLPDSSSFLLQLVKPSQLVMQLPSGCSLKPYCYRVPSSLQRYVHFLTAVGVRQELRAKDYVEILCSIQNVLGDEKSIRNENTHDKEVIKCAYFEIVRCLRQGDILSMNVSAIWLPDQTINLVQVQNLCFNDAPWYEDRLPDDCGLKMILLPPSDEKGSCTLPKNLKVKLLSEIITEELVDSCRSPDHVCNAEELYAQDKRSEGERCIFVRKILDTLKSKELLYGLCRMYYTEHQVTPSQSFMQSIYRLRHIQVRCINKIKTVLSVNGKLNPQTEDSRKLCYVCTEGTSLILYIAPGLYPHDIPLVENLLLSDLAFCVRKLVNSEIRDLVPIAAAFACEPDGISQALNRHNVSQYTFDSDKDVKPVLIGTPVSWSEHNHQDSLIVLNFEPRDQVCYLCDDGSLINAEVVDSKPISHNTMSQPDFLEPTLTIKVQEDDIESECDKDEGERDRSASFEVSEDSNSCDSDSECEQQVPGTTINDVSPSRVFKVLSIPQRKSLWGEGNSQFACPIILASVPFGDFSSLEQWLHKIFASRLVASYTELTFKVLTFRLLRHIHYVLVVQKKAPSLFNRAAMKLHEIVAEKERSGKRVQYKRQQTQEELVEMMENLSLEDHATYTKDEDTAGEAIDEDKSSALKVNCNIFPSASLIKILDGDNCGHNNVAGDSDHGKQSVRVPFGVRNIKAVRNKSLPVQAPSSRANISAPVASQMPSATNQPPQMPSATSQPPVSRFMTTAMPRSQRRQPQQRTSRFIPPSLATAPPQPKTCMQSATAWLEQAKADFKAAGRLLHVYTTSAAVTSAAESASGGMEVEFPALVCFLCHDTVEKCLKGILYAYCGLKPSLVENGNLVTLCDCLNSSQQCPRPLLDSIKDCVMSISTHENRSRFPNYQNPPCAPASIYDTEDAEEAFLAAKKLIEHLKSEDKFSQILGDLEEMPVRRYISTLRSVTEKQGKLSYIIVV